MRCFISVNLPKDLASAVHEFSRELQDQGLLMGNFVKSGNLHLNLKFLGEVSSQKVAEIKRQLEQIRVKSFEISLVGLGGFPSENYVRVLWIDLDKGQSELTKLQREVDDRLAKIGFQKEKQFVPHLTLARIKFVRDKSALRSLFNHRREREFGSFWCDKLNFMKSELTPDGPTYEEI